MTTTENTVFSAITADIAAAVDAWVEQGGIAALTAADIETIARDHHVTTAAVVAAAQGEGVAIIA